jgi:YfiH family protein
LLPCPPCYLEQVHGNDVVILDRLPDGEPPVADAAVTRVAGLVLAVRVADCLPVLLADERGSVIGAAHAGWRGLAAGVLEATIAAMDVDPARIAAWIGPGIGPRAFEVGDDVRAAFTGRDDARDRHFAPLREGKWLADLPGLARERLARAGVAAIDDVALCTYADPQRFFSYRREPLAGRMAAYIWRDRRHSATARGR